jgi:two-component system chemotaxis sensor kinase CheA
MVRAGLFRYAIPLSPVEEITRIDPAALHDVIGRKVVKIRDKIYPIYRLSAVLGARREEGDCHYAVLVSMGTARFCLAVDEMLGQEEVVIKNIEGLNTSSSAILGATITGDGKVVLILELGNVLRRAKSQVA